jgi:hypothetical protein
MVESVSHGLFFVVNDGGFPNYDQVQQLKCFICFPDVIPPSLIKKKTKGEKGIIAYNTSFGTGSMKRHVEPQHLELIIAYVEEVAANNILGS